VTAEPIERPDVTGAEPDDVPGERLWTGDLGLLPAASRRCLLTLIKGPYLSYARHPQQWAALKQDEPAIRSRLHDLFLDLVIDEDALVAYVRNVAAPDADAPRTVRSARLTFMDTAMLLLLRQQLVAAPPGERVIVGLDEVAEQLEVYRQGTDPSDHRKRVNASWRKLDAYGLLQPADGGRFEISPVLRLVLGPDEVAALRTEYRRIAEGGDAAVHLDDETEADA